MDITTKKEALENDSIFYFTGKPCKYGHVSVRLVKGGACRECNLIKASENREQNREQYNKYCREKKKEHYSTEKRRESYKKNIHQELFYSAKTRANNKKISFTISKEDVIIPDKCPVFGIPLDSRDRLHAPTLDRIIAGGEYSKNNIRIVCNSVNSFRNKWADEIFFYVCKKVTENNI